MGEPPPPPPPPPPALALPPVTLYFSYGRPVYPVITPMSQREVEENGAFRKLIVVIMVEIIGYTPSGRGQCWQVRGER